MQARTTGLEPATTGSTVRYSNQLSYVPKFVVPNYTSAPFLIKTCGPAAQPLGHCPQSRDFVT